MSTRGSASRDGYRAYGYLGDGADGDTIPLVPEFDRVSSSAPTLDAAQEERVERLMRVSPIISAHDHPTIRPADPADFVAYRRRGRDVTGYAGIASSGVDVFFDGMMNGTAFITSTSGWKWTDIVHDIGMRLCDLAHQDVIRPVFRVADIGELKATSRVGLVLALEAATPIENELDRLDVLFGLGVRSIGLTYSSANALGSGLAEESDAGLTHFGRAAVHRMNQLGLLIDLAHTGDRTSLDAIEASEHPVVISHAGARALWNSNRMKPDDVIKACCESGGVIGIEAAPHTTITRDRREHSLESVMEHFEYCANLVGIQHVAFGPDTHFGDHVAWHEAFAGALSVGEEPEDLVHPSVEFVDGIENPHEGLRNVARWLVGHGYDDAQIVSVLGGNLLRVIEQVWPS